MSSILNDVKEALGIVTADTSFDSVLIQHINSTLPTLTQLGVGPLTGFSITGPAETWDQFFTDQRLNAVKSYVSLKVRLLFDPPTTGFTQQAFERQIEEMEFRILADADL